MADEVVIEGRDYISSKRASESTGYAQDYIGQLARRGLIDARRVGGLWYVSQTSLASYKGRTDTYKPEPRRSVQNSSAPLDAVVSLDGKDYISASRAAEVTGYHQDYVGQLAREGRVLSRQIGSRWYVERAGVMAHKKEKDALLASVQVEAVGLRPGPKEASEAKWSAFEPTRDTKPYFIYTNDDGDLLPLSGETPEENLQAEVNSGGLEYSPGAGKTALQEHKIPIRVLTVPPRAFSRDPQEGHIARKSLSEAWKSGLSWAAATLATVVIVLTIGYVSVTNNALYAKIMPDSSSALVSQATEALSRIGDLLEAWLAPEITYRRPN